MVLLLRPFSPRALTRSALLLLVIAACGGCMGGHTLNRRAAPGSAHLAWFGPDSAAERLALDRWRISVGPPVVHAGALASPKPGNEITVVSWNTALGAGDVARLVAEVRTRIGRDAPLVLLLQEVYRRGAEVPAALAPGSMVAGRLGALPPNGRRDDVEAIAAALGFGVCYVPSMRNGSPSESDEDRGNAILSNLPLSELAAIELPFERQRRVAVAASIRGVSHGRRPWSLRLVSTHLDNMVGARRGWIVGAEYARARQARGLVRLLGADMPTVVGGDFNTWFGFSDKAYVETAFAFPQTEVSDTRATFQGLLRLDHLFFRLPPGWRADFRRENDRFGSDHHPLIATIRF